MLAAAGAVLTTAPESTARRGVHGEHNLRSDNAIMCVAGETRRVAKKHRPRYLKQGATGGECVASGCPAGQVSCNGGCIAESVCCTNADCTIAQICVSGVCTSIPCTRASIV